MANKKVSIVARNAELNALGALLNNGYIRVYAGSQPASPETAISSQTLLAELRFGATAFASASAASMAANSIAQVTIAASGTAAFFRCLESDGSTPVVDGDVSTTTAATGDMQLDSVTLGAGAKLNVNSLSIGLPQ